MKSGSEDYRAFSIQGIKVIVYEPVLEEDEFFHSKVIRDLDEFKKLSDLIVVNRMSDDI